jgi:hypothetical protein
MHACMHVVQAYRPKRALLLAVYVELAASTRRLYTIPLRQQDVKPCGPYAGFSHARLLVDCMRLHKASA